MLSSIMILALSVSATPDLQGPTTPEGLRAAIKAGLPKLQEAERNMGSCKCVASTETMIVLDGKKNKMVRNHNFTIARSGDKMMLDRPADNTGESMLSEDRIRMVYDDGVIAVSKFEKDGKWALVTTIPGSKPVVFESLFAGSESLHPLTWMGLGNVNELLAKKGVRITLVKPLENGFG